MRSHGAIAALALLLSSCSPETANPSPVDAADERTDSVSPPADRVAADRPLPDASIDLPTADRLVPTDAPAAMDVRDAAQDLPPAMDVSSDDALRVLGCDPVPGAVATMTFDPSPTVAPAALTLHLRAPDPWANLDVSVRTASGASLSPVWAGVTERYHWQWTVSPTAPGDYCVTVRTDPSATLRWRGPLRITGTAPPPPPPPPPGSFVTRRGSELYAGADRLRFVGMNLRALPHVGTPILPYASAAQIEAELAACEATGVRVVRVFAAAHDASNATVAARLGPVLDAAARHHLYVIAALTDFYNTGMSPQGDDGAYSAIGGYTILNPDFFRTGYRAHYLPFARELAGRYAAHPALMAWELGNEIKCDADHGAFLAFAREVSAAIRAVDARHLIASGMITWHWMSIAEATSLYSDANMDLVTIHDYNGDHLWDDDVLARSVGRPSFIEEAGFEGSGRAARVDADIRHWIDGRGARGYMQWGFTAVTPDNGNGDRQFGMDHLTHAGDWDALAAVYSSAAARVR